MATVVFVAPPVKVIRTPKLAGTGGGGSSAPPAPTTGQLWPK